MRLAEAIFVALLFSTTGCWYVGPTCKGTASDGSKARLRHIELPSEWKDVAYYSYNNYQEFAATADEGSWKAWCKANHMPSATPDEVHISKIPKPRFIEVDFTYDAESVEGLSYLRSKVKDNGGSRQSWYDPERRMMFYREAMW